MMPMNPTRDGRDGGWPDLMRARMFEERVVLVNGDLDDALAGQVATELMTLDACGDVAVRLLLNSGGGTFGAAFTLIDVIDLLGVPVHATCIGRAEGAALGVLAVAARRLAIPHARLRLFEPTHEFAGRADDVASWAAQREHDRQRFCARIAEATGQPSSSIAAAMGEGRVLDVHEAMRAGLIDGVATSSVASVRGLDQRPIGFRSRRSPAF
jgi:ATP-dependent Clp protease, protease subunit